MRRVSLQDRQDDDQLNDIEWRIAVSVGRMDAMLAAHRMLQGRSCYTIALRFLGNVMGQVLTLNIFRAWH